MSITEKKLEHLDSRLARIESRLCQLMYHLGLDPNVRMYDEPRDVCPLPVSKAVTVSKKY